MEEIYAKFVSQKISKTRWRPLPPGSLQTAETFATGSWDNEVPLRPAWSPCYLLPSRNRAPVSQRANSCFVAPSAVLSTECTSHARSPYIWEPSVASFLVFLMIIMPSARDTFKAGLIEGSAHFNFGEFDVYFISKWNFLLFRKIMFQCGLLEILETWILMEDLKETINYCAVSNIMVM